ncbi:MAG: hypothetical protein ACXVB0_24080, partial [Mucilaginibacter sp.]
VVDQKQAAYPAIVAIKIAPRNAVKRKNDTAPNQHQCPLRVSMLDKNTQIGMSSVFCMYFSIRIQAKEFNYL